MWLLPVFSPVSSLAVRTFYRVAVSGSDVPESGPVLLVANHPNSLLDPAMVSAVAGRPVRFLAKAPLFTDPLVGWLIRGSGSIPVYRRMDDPADVGKNDDTFRAVHAALAEGAAVGIFPEGISHSAPAMAPLKTGAARIALGAAGAVGHPFLVIPVGLTFRAKETFRSEALVVIGEPVAWNDLAGRGEDDRDAVHEMTERVADALQAVTLNLEEWEDRPLVETAEAVFAAERDADPAPKAQVARLRETTRVLATLRHRAPEEWTSLASAVAAHARALRILRMTPAQLKGAPGASDAGKWVARQLTILRTLLPVAAVGIALYFIPYRLTGMAEARARPSHDVRGTFKALVGAVLHVIWTLLLAGTAWWLGGWKAGLAALVLLPAIAWVTLWTVDLWRRADGEARRFFLRARRRDAVEQLRRRQERLAVRLEQVWRETGGGEADR